MFDVGIAGLPGPEVALELSVAGPFLEAPVIAHPSVVSVIAVAVVVAVVVAAVVVVVFAWPVLGCT